LLEYNVNQCRRAYCFFCKKRKRNKGNAIPFSR